MSPAKRLYLSSLEVFRDLSEEQIHEIDGLTRMRACARGELLYTPADPREVLFILKKGRVKLFRLSPEGRTLVLTLLEPGAFFGEMPLVGVSMHGAFAQVLDEAVLCVMERDEVRQLLLRFPLVALRLLESVGKRLSELEGRLEELAFRGVPARLASLLIATRKAKGIPGGLGDFGFQLEKSWHRLETGTRPPPQQGGPMALTLPIGIANLSC